MKMDNRVISGIFIGIILGLHYHGALITYMPLLVVITMIMLLRLVHR